ncbi:MAG: hypothetical protein SPI18_08180 [Prevotella sp.]|nr:hypothetical protein [Prevotella sp.]
MNHNIMNTLSGIATLLSTNMYATPQTGSIYQTDNTPIYAAEPVKYMFLCYSDGSEAIFPLADNPAMELSDKELIIESTTERISTDILKISRFYLLENKTSTNIQQNKTEKTTQAKTSVQNGHIRLSGLPAGTPVRLYATDGRCVAEKTILNSEDTDIDLTIYQKGVYILHLPAGQLKVMNR